MKYLFALVLPVLMLFSGFSGFGNVLPEAPASPKDSVSPGYILLVNVSGRQINFIYHDRFDDRVSIFLQPSSTFKLYTDRPVFLIQTNRNQNFYILYPGEKIDVNVSPRDNAVLSTKKDSLRDNELDFSRSLNETVDLTFMKMNQFRTKNIQRDYLKVDSLYRKEYADNLLFLTGYKSKKAISEKYECYIKAYFIAHLYGVQLHFIGTEKRDALSPEYVKYLLSLEGQVITDPLFKGDVWFNKLQYAFLKYKYAGYGPASADSVYASAKSKLEGEDKSRIMFWTVQDALKQPGEAGKWIVSDFLSVNRDADYKTQIETLIADKSIQAGRGEAIGMIDGQRRNFDYDSLVKSLKGHVIYIDFWASWCVPCRNEMPASRRWKNHYANEPVKFIYVSIDENTGNWRKASEQEAIQTYQYNYWLPDFKNSKLYKLFGIKTVPRYVLIDKNGKVANADAPRPSNPELKVALDKLIKE